MLGVPLMSGDDVLGILHVGRLSDRSFGDDDINPLQVVADRVAGATQTRALAIERAATRLLERSLLPARLPSCPGLGFATRYVPPRNAPSAVIGMTFSCFPPDSCGLLSATWPVTVCKRQC